MRHHLGITQDPGAVYPALGRRVREFRKRRQLTQEALAALVGLKRASIANIEQGRQKFLVHTMLQLMQVLRVKPDEFLDGLMSSPEEAPLEMLLGAHPPDAQAWIRSAVALYPVGRRKRGRTTKANS